MRVKTKYKLELICSRDNLRPAIENLSLREVKGKPSLCATDGRKLVVIPVVESDPSEYGNVPKEALTIARRKRQDKRSDTVKLVLNGKVEFENGWTMPRDQELTFPNVESVIPGARSETQISFSAKYLYEIAQSMGVDTVTLNLSSNNTDPIRVTAPGEEAFAVLMPLRT